MPFLAHCVFCGQSVRAPDHALGASMCCPKCSNLFTLAPSGEKAAPSRGEVLATAVKSKAPAPRAPYPRQVSDSKQASRPGAAAEIGRLTKTTVVIPQQGIWPKSPWINLFGLGAFLFCGAALLSAWVSWLCGLVVPLSVVSLFLGLVGLVRALAQGLSCRLFSAVGTALGGVVLFIAVVWPSFLGRVYLASRAREAVDPWAIRVVPLPGSRGGDAGLRDSEWVDASRAALQQGGLYLRVLSASVRPEEARSTPTKKAPPREYLFLRLRTQQAAATSGLVTNRSHTASPQFENARPSLRDNTGKVYQPRDVQEVAALENGRKAPVFPVVFQDQVFVFEAPAPGLAHLRLEVPAEAWGGEGAFRFTIPASMIVHERAGPAGLAGGR